MSGAILNELYQTICERKKSADLTDGLADKSYTKYLFREGLNKILKKVGEEAAETIIAAKDTGVKNYNARVIEETSDLIYHLLVMLAELGIEFSDVEAELVKRAKKTNNMKG